MHVRCSLPTPRPLPFPPVPGAHCLGVLMPSPKPPEPGVTAQLSPAPLRSRRTLIYLILTLNAIYPDYDFSQLRPHHFLKEPGPTAVEQVVDTHLIDVSKARTRQGGKDS